MRQRAGGMVILKVPGIRLAAVLCGLAIATAPALAASTARTQTQAQTQTPPQAPLDPLRQFDASVQALVRKVGPSVVQVLGIHDAAVPTTQTSQSDSQVSAGQGQRTLGSGVIVDPDGYIVTNAHVVADAQRIQVVLAPSAGDDSPASSMTSGGRLFEAHLVGAAQEVDLALLKVDATGLPARPLADYGELRQGQLVFAFGSPEGLRNSVTMGVISAVARQPDADNPMVFIQTDAPINPGNSGGPLVNVDGAIVGLNTYILTDSGGSQGLGFAIPSAIVGLATTQLRTYGHLRRGEIGVGLQAITPDLAHALGLDRDSGVIVADVRPGSAAEQAGVQVQDVIVSVDGKPADNLFLLSFLLYTRVAGDRIRLTVLRGATRTDVVVPVAERPADDAPLTRTVDPQATIVERLGVAVVTVDDRIRTLLPGLRTPSGVAVVAIPPDDRAIAVPLAIGDVIHAVNGHPVATLDDLRGLLDAGPPHNPLALLVEREGQLLFLSGRD